MNLVNPRSSHRVTAWLLAFAAILPLAGCIGGPGEPAPDEPTNRWPPASEQERASISEFLSPPRFPETPLAEVHWISSFDGTQLRTRIFRPDAPADWKAPIILHMSPYFALEDVASDGLDAWLLSYFVSRGYAIVLNDVRGTGESGGCLEHTGRNEAQDGYVVVEYVAALPWTNGKVGMIGVSYDAETQQAAATTAPPHLTTIIPVESIAALYDHVYFDGVPYTSVGIVGAGSYAAQGLLPPRPPVDPGGEPNPYSPGVYAERPLCHAENTQQRSDPRGDFNAYWEDRDFRRRIPEIRNTSIFFVHGLEDWNVKPIHIAGWYNALDIPKHAWIGQWQHEFPDQNSFQPEWRRNDWHFAVHRWFDHWLLGIDTGLLLEPAVQVQDSTGRWRLEDAWPPRDLPKATFYLTGDARLERTPVPAQSRIEYADNGLPMESGQGESVSWVSAPLPRPVHYAGLPRLNLTAAITSPLPVGSVSGTHFAAHLIDVAPDASERIINRGYLDAQHRNTLNRSEPVPNGQDVLYNVRFYPQDDVIPAGHRLKLRLGAVDEWIQPDGTNARVLVLVGGEASRLEFPVIEDAAARFFTPTAGDS